MPFIWPNDQEVSLPEVDVEAERLGERMAQRGKDRDGLVMDEMTRAKSERVRRNTPPRWIVCPSSTASTTRWAAFCPRELSYLAPSADLGN
jgi:hypothetical protein